MPTVVVPEPSMTKKNADKAKPSPVTSQASFERVEFQAPIGFTADLDEARKARGLSRAAYIRQAVLLLMQEDKRSKS